MWDPILVMLLKMQPHYSQSSRENATSSSDTSLLASYGIGKYQPPPPPPTPFPGQFVASPSLVTFARVYMALNKITKMASQRDKASQWLVKHYIIIMVSLHSFP